MDERDWLRAYVEKKDANAFARLVERYVDLVYSSALRQVRNTTLADDVTQSVFLILVEKAAHLKPNVILSGWLVLVTRYVAINALKRESRKKRREEEVARMNSQMRSQENQSFGERQERQEVLSAIDSAIARLGTRDREAIALRYFDGYDIAKVAAVLGISADAAKQRLHRAVEKLREICSSSGITARSAAVGAALAESVIIKAPAGMAQAAAAGALSGGSSATIILAKGAMLAMTMKKAQAAAVVLFGVLLLTTVALLTMFDLSRQSPLQAAKVEPVSTQPAPPPDAPKLLEPTTEKWGMPSENPDPPIEANDPPEAIIAPAVDATTIRTRDPDHTYHGIAARTWDQFGLMQFDISEIKTPPQKAVLRAGVFLVENTRNLRTPARLKFYRITTKWDPSATARFADSHRKIPWKAGEFFRGDSHADLNQKQIGEVEIPNPPPRGFAVEVDVTELVQKWVSGEWPNYGIMVRCDQLAGYSYQVNLNSHVDKRYPIEIMVVPAQK